MPPRPTGRRPLITTPLALRSSSSWRAISGVSGSTVMPYFAEPSPSRSPESRPAFFAAAFSVSVALNSLVLPSRRTPSVIVVPGVVAAISLRNEFVSTTARPW